MYIQTCQGKDSRQDDVLFDSGTEAPQERYRLLNCQRPWLSRSYGTVAYEHEDQTIQEGIDRAAADKEIIDIETVTLGSSIASVPEIVEGTTAGLSSKSYHWVRILVPLEQYGKIDADNVDQTNNPHPNQEASESRDCKDAIIER